jgi:hypothetical protein
LQDPISREKKLGVMACICHSSYERGHRKEGHDLRLALGKNRRPYLKNNLKKQK